MERVDVLVIGLGAAGAATLYQLAKRGMTALGVDRHVPPHVHGSSHGETRITRQAIGEGADYVPLALRAHAIWRELEAATGAELFVPCGGLIIGRLEGGAELHGEAGFLRSTVAQARRFGIAHELLDRRTTEARFPQMIGLAPDEVGYYEPGAGFLRPEACVAAQLAEAARLGAGIRTGLDVRAIRETGAAVEVDTDAGSIRARRAVVAAGAWTGALLGPPFDRLLRVTRQSLFWFEASEPALYDPAAGCPVFIRQHGPAAEDLFYGFPTPAGGVGVKLATERDDDALSPLDYAAGPARDDPAAFHARHVAGRLRGVGPGILKSSSCLYTSTPTSRFLIGPHPAMSRVMVVSACSGHGFKHSAAIAELVAEHLHSDLALRPFRLTTSEVGSA